MGVSLKKVVNYIFRDSLIIAYSQNLWIDHTTPSNQIQEQSFKEIQKNCSLLSKKEGCNKFYMDVITLPKQPPHISEQQQIKALKTMVALYMKRRSPKSVSIATIHKHPELGNYHAHIVFSANNYQLSKRHTLNTSEYNQCKEKTRSAFKRYYPHLERENVRTKTKEKKNVIKRIWGRIQSFTSKKKYSLSRIVQKFSFRSTTPQITPKSTELQPPQPTLDKTKALEPPEQKKLTKRELLAEDLKKVFTRSYTKEDFKEQLEKMNFKIHCRSNNGIITGVQNVTSGTKYKFKTLGLSESFNQLQNQWEATNHRNKEYQNILDNLEQRKRKKTLKREYG